MAVSKRVRFEILRRDGHTCRYCGAQAPDVKLTVDHVIPEALGGSDEPSNLVTACADCNSGKTSTAPDQAVVEDVSEDALRWAKAAREVAETRRTDRQELTNLLVRFDDLWMSWEPKDRFQRPLDWDRSIEGFLNAGLDESDIRYFVDVAWSRHLRGAAQWKYFCGCCWTEIGKRTEATAEKLASGEDDT